MKDSINQKAQRKKRVHAIDSTRGMADCMVEERCENCNAEIHAKSEYEALLHEYASRPKIRIST